MEIRNYINIFWRRKLTILLTLIVTIIIVVVGTKQIVPVYQASTILRVAVSAGGSVSYTDYMYADRLMNTYVNIATSRPVQEEIMKRLSLSMPPNIKAEIISNTELIKITVEDTNPEMAAKIANTLADVLITQSSKLFIGGGKSLTEVLGAQLTTAQEDLESTRKDYERLLIQTPPVQQNIDATQELLQLKQNNYASLLGQYEQAKFREEIQSSMITVFDEANVPRAPYQPRMLLNIALGFIVGLAGGVGLALILENLDTTLYDVEDIEATAKLSAIVRIPKANKKEIITLEENFSPLAEAFRSLATNLQLANHHPSKKALLLVSAEPNQGKSMITFHLACSLAELGNDVVVVDCDTRIPRLHSIFHLPNEMGLKDVLEQRVDLDEALQMSSFDGVHVLTSGSRFSHPSQMLGSDQMSKLVKNLKQDFDYVLLDSPAMLGLADVTALTPSVDGLILVVRRGYAKKEAVQAASNFLAEQKGKFTFLIVNQVEDTNHYYYYKNKKKTESLLGLVKKTSN